MEQLKFNDLAPEVELLNMVIKSGANGFLKKPFYPADVDPVLERYYGLHAPRG